MYRPPSLGMGAYTPFGPLYSVLNTLMQVCSSLNIYQSGAFEVGYKYNNSKHARTCVCKCTDGCDVQVGNLLSALSLINHNIYTQSANSMWNASWHCARCAKE